MNMKLFKTLFTFFIIVIISITFITLCPTKSDFAEYYVQQNSTGLGKFFDETYEKIILQKTSDTNYLIFSVFEVDETNRYVGLLGHFFGPTTTEEVAQTVDNLINQA